MTWRHLSGLVVAAGLFLAGVWMVYPPAAYIAAGALLTVGVLYYPTEYEE